MSEFTHAFLRTEAQRMSFETELGLLGTSVSDSNRATPNHEQIKNHLETMCSSNIRPQLSKYLKEHRAMPEGDYTVSHLVGRNSYHCSPDGYVFLDGDYGWLLSQTYNQESTPLAAVSFSNFEQIQMDWANKVDFSRMIPNSIIVKQLQGFKYTRGPFSKKENAKNILSHFRWEHFFVDTVVNWSKDMNFRAVYIQPSSLNYWHNRDLASALKIRYDVTAHRMNFAKDNQGLYVLLLS